MDIVIKIKDVRAKMVNVTLKGLVRRKLPQITTPQKKPNQKYFSFYLVDEDSEIRLTAYNNAAETHFPQVISDKYVQITNITIKENTYMGVTDLQISIINCLIKVFYYYLIRIVTKLNV